MKKIAMVVSSSLLMLNSTALLANGNMNQYEVTVTNTTYAQVLTPPLVVSHRNHFRVFEIGAKASEELKTMAETGNPGPLADNLADAYGVKAVATGDSVIPPGHSLTVTINSPRGGKISVMGMLASTNDAIYAVQGVRVPFYEGMAMAAVYDAGTEANTELCSDIPGPPCSGPNNEVTDGSEGFIHMHRGFHGVNQGTADPMAANGMGLEDSMLDWRGPAAKITIKRK